MKIEHLAIWVKDLELMRAFYETYFDATSGNIYHNSSKEFTSYFLSFEGGPRLELMQLPNMQKKSRGIEEYLGYAHLAISVGSKDRVDGLTENLRKAGFQIIGQPRTTGDGYYESVVLDPEQNKIEITV